MLPYAIDINKEETPLQYYKEKIKFLLIINK